MFNSLLQGGLDRAQVPGSRETGIHLWTAIGWHLGYEVPLARSLRAQATVSRTDFTPAPDVDALLREAFLGPSASVAPIYDFIPNKRVEQAFVGLLWGGGPLSAGVEYAWGRRSTFGIERGVQSRLNSMLCFSFD